MPWPLDITSVELYMYAHCFPKQHSKRSSHGRHDFYSLTYDLRCGITAKVSKSRNLFYVARESYRIYRALARLGMTIICGIPFGPFVSDFFFINNFDTRCYDPSFALSRSGHVRAVWPKRSIRRSTVDQIWLWCPWPIAKMRSKQKINSKNFEGNFSLFY